MASTKFNIMLAFIVIISPSIVAATEYIVGDDQGWTGTSNYTAWAENKMFYVGDTLVFKYPVPKHNVYKVNATDFQGCIVPAAPNEALATGNDVITLKTPGKKWYICGKPNHCTKLGMKLVINVMEGTALAPAPSSAPLAMLNSWFQVFVVGVAAAVVMVVG